jgi:hypothetical protein
VGETTNERKWTMKKETSKTNDPNVIFIRHHNGETETKYVNSDFECRMEIRKRDKRIKM